MPDCPHEAHDESGSKDTVTLPQPWCGESCLTQLLEDAGHQPCRETHQQMGGLVVDREYTRKELGREK